jgi:hypothetical protein
MPLHVARNTAFCHAAILDHSEWPCRPLGGVLAALVARCATVGQGRRQGCQPTSLGSGAGVPTYISGQGRQPTSLTTCPRGDARGHAHALGVRLDSPGMSMASRAASRCASGATYREISGFAPPPLLYPVCRWHLERNAAVRRGATGRIPCRLPSALCGDVEPRRLGGVQMLSFRRSIQEDDGFH